LYALPKPGPGFPSAKAINLFGIQYIYDMSWEVVICFVDIDEIVDHHCLNFHFIKTF
jgi:hypothetical protein